MYCTKHNLQLSVWHCHDRYVRYQTVIRPILSTRLNGQLPLNAPGIKENSFENSEFCTINSAFCGHNASV